MIISVSRRCDIPRFRFDWFMERLEAGFVDVMNPFNAGQFRRVSLLPGMAEFFVFWTRDPRLILANAEEFSRRGFPFYVMVTVTGYPAALEPNVPPMETVCGAMRELARKTGDRRVIWRYDPVLLSSITDADFHCRNFSVLAHSLAGSVRRVIISRYDEYTRAKQRLDALEKADVLRLPPDTGADMITGVFSAFAETAAAAGMEIQTCAEAENYESTGIRPGACIDGTLIRELSGLETEGKDKNQRPHCRCAKSVDIGRYGDCAAGCVYCYAR